MIKEASLCGLGKTAPNPILSTILHFSEEYEAHVKQKKCPAGVCEKALKRERKQLNQKLHGRQKKISKIRRDY